MRIVCISDTHNKHKKITIPDGDVLVHAGDMSSVGHPHELSNAAQWMSKLPHKHKFVICGNHEYHVSEDTETMKAFFEPFDIQVVHNEVVEVDGFRFYGEPRTPEFFDWGWMYPRAQGHKIWKDLPPNLDLLLTHGPPHGFGDYVDNKWNLGGAHVGCGHLREKLIQRHEQGDPIRYLVCGHIHAAYGVYATDFETVVVNASICTEEYEPRNAPVVLHLEK